MGFHVRRSPKAPRPAPVLGELAAIEPRIRSCARMLLFLDFDGTLSPIAPHPAQATLMAGTRDLLWSISGHRRATVAIISGRGLADVRERVGIPGLIYAGNHGIEIQGRSFSFREPRCAALQPVLEHLAARLTDDLHEFPGVHVEDKGLTISVHHRQASERTEARVRHYLRALLETHNDLLKVTTGHKVIEIRPSVSWNKGDAVKWIRGRLAPDNDVCMYIGDDRTDEDAFAVLPEGITVRVGGGITGARYRAAGPEEVRRLLSWVKEILVNKGQA